MADNVAITAGSGTTIAADDVSSVYYQKVKLDFGGDGATATGVTPFWDSSVDNSVQTMKSSAGYLYFLEVTNSNTTDCWLQLFDATSPSVGTPLFALLVPAGDGTKSGGNDLIFTVPLQFTNSIKYAATTTATGSTSPTTALKLSGGYI